MTDSTLAADRQAQPSGFTKADISGIAEAAAKRFGYSPGEDIQEVVRRLGGKIEVRDTLTEDPKQSGSLIVNNKSDFVIVVPSHTSLLRDKFTIAHELGHFVIHYLLADKSRESSRMVALRKGSDRVEWEANWFAAAFLMPKTAFSDAYAKYKDPVIVSRMFGVSPKAAEIRAKQLGIEND